MSPPKGQPSPVKGRHFEKETYSPDEIRALLEQTAGESFVEIRNHALIATLWQSGLRISEALDLVPRDFTFNPPEIHVRHGKGDKERRVSPGPLAVESTRKWVEPRAGVAGPSDPLFCTRDGNRLHDTYVRAMLQRLAKRAGWEKRIHPHGFRHTFAANLARNGMAVPYIQRQLGHDSLSTTSIYLATISVDDIREAMERVTW